MNEKTTFRNTGTVGQAMTVAPEKGVVAARAAVAETAGATGLHEAVETATSTAAEAARVSGGGGAPGERMGSQVA